MTDVQHDCCFEAARHLLNVNGRTRFLTVPSTQEGPLIKYCPWCAETLHKPQASLLYRRRADPFKLRD